MPTYTKPPKPQLVWGVFDQHRSLVVPQPERPDRNHFVGWKCEPSYHIGGTTITSNRDEAEARLTETTRRWQRRVREVQRSVLTLKDVFEGRQFLNATPDPFYDYVHFYMEGGGFITLQRTRWSGMSLPKVTGAYETPFTVTKVYANCRRMKIDDGSYLDFPRKMEIMKHTIGDTVLDQIYKTD